MMLLIIVVNGQAVLSINNITCKRSDGINNIRSTGPHKCLLFSLNLN